MPTLTRVHRECRPTTDRELPCFLCSIDQVIEHFKEQLNVIRLIKLVVCILHENDLDVAIIDVLREFDGSVVRHVGVLHAVEETDRTLRQFHYIVVEQAVVLLDVERELCRHQMREVQCLDGFFIVFRLRILGTKL